MTELTIVDITLLCILMSIKMAVIWSKTVDNTQYEVRLAGNTRRLYRDGVLHSAYNPSKPISNNIWDLLFLPTLFHEESPKRVLILGVGGGVVIHLLNRFAQPKSIVGIEIDKTHIDIARKYFDLQDKNLQLAHADAIDWLNKYKGPVFDLIIEDVFIEEAGEPLRLMHGDKQWLAVLRKNLSPNGTLVINHATDSEARFTKKQATQYASCFQFSLPLLENKVLALLKQSSSVAALNKRLEADPSLLKLKQQSKLDYSCRKIY